MKKWTGWLVATLLSFSAAAVASEGAGSGSDALYMEINKLEQRDNLCVAYIRFSNKSDLAFSEFKSELFAFDKEEVIASHFLADFQQVMANKTVIKLVPMKDVECDRVSSVLLNQMLSCKSGDEEIANCMQRINTGSKSAVKLFK